MSALTLFGNRPPLVLSYDIACQWAIHLRERIAHDNFPSHLRIELPEGPDLRFLIPKYHFSGHTGEDHSKYSFNLVRGVGRTDGEEVERNWWRHDATAASTREMGPGSRHDTLEDHFQWSNFEKFVGIGKYVLSVTVIDANDRPLGRSLAKKLKRTLRGFTFHDRLWKQFAEDILATDIERWTSEVEAWEEDMLSSDPYYQEPSGELFVFIAHRPSSD